jgi:hypothetical protein
MSERRPTSSDLTPDPGDARAPGRKRAYTRPVLTEYGSVAKLTRSNGSTQFEASSDSIMQKMCL